MNITVLITGGTLDKNYFEETGCLGFNETHVPSMLNEARCLLNVSYTSLFLKDSLEMTETDRHQILGACHACDDPAIVITHGTDTMVETALFLKSQLTSSHTVVLTGAMRPYCLGHSDSLFNLGTALMAAQCMSKGVYIAMNGQLFDPESVQKNRKLGQFEDIK